MPCGRCPCPDLHYSAAPPQIGFAPTAANFWIFTGIFCLFQLCSEVRSLLSRRGWHCCLCGAAAAGQELQRWPLAFPRLHAPPRPQTIGEMCAAATRSSTHGAVVLSLVMTVFLPLAGYLVTGEVPFGWGGPVRFPVGACSHPSRSPPLPRPPPSHPHHADVPVYLRWLQTASYARYAYAAGGH